MRFEQSLSAALANPAAGLLALDKADSIEDELLESMTTPISDLSSASAVVPLLLRGPESAGAAIKLIKFERSFDPQLAIRMERALERILQGINLPKEIASGLSQLKYSSSQVVQESLYTQHVEPMILMLCDAWRTIWLEPALRLDGIPQEEIDKIVVWYDPSGVMTAPDRSNAANVGFNNRAISWKAWREANGFSDDDAPDTDELAQRLALDRGQINDAIMEQLLATIMPDILKKTREAQIAGSPAPLSDDVQNLLDGRESPPDTIGGDAPTEPPVGLAEPGGSSTPPPPPAPPLAGPPPGSV